MIISPAKITFEILDEFGNLEFRKDQLMKSFVSNWVNYIRGHLSNAGATMKDTGGTNRNHLAASTLYVYAAEAVTTYGIRVGTSNQVVAIADNVLIGPIAHGNGGGQLYHKVTSVSAVTVTAPLAYFTIQRNFDNNSGGSITVEEVALQVYDDIGGWYFLIARDVTGGVAVANAKTFVATYTYSSSV